MEYIYAAMLLHKANQKIDDAAVKKVLQAAGITPDDARVKALVAALDGVDIDKAIKEAVVSAPAAASSAPVVTAEKKEAKPEKSAEDEKKQEEQAAAGLGALFG